MRSTGVNQEQIERLRKYEDKILKIICTDGEVLEAKLLFVDREYEDAIYDLVSSTTPEKYPKGTAAAYVIRWDDIVSFEEAPLSS
jgi:hypothetical protein